MFSAMPDRKQEAKIKKIGILGGVAWPSTVDYYSMLCRLSEQWHIARKVIGRRTMPEFSIESLDLARVISCIGSDSNETSCARFDAYHNAGLRRLEASGANFAIIASNTPHHRFETIARGIRIPVLNIIDAAAAECARIGARQVLLLGTELTMGSSVFRDGFARHGVTAIGPQDQPARSKTAELIAALQCGRTNGAVDRIRRIVTRSFAQFGEPPAVCLACTELPQAFQKMKKYASFEYDGVRYINSSVCHINSAFDFATS